MAFVEDLSIFFDTSGFGDKFFYKTTRGQSLALIGIFDAGYYAAPGGEVAVASNQPQIQYQTAAIPNTPIYGEVITFKGQDYTIVGIHPDGTGVTTLMLEKADAAC